MPITPEQLKKLREKIKPVVSEEEEEEAIKEESEKKPAE